MLKKTITYEDFNGDKRTEDFYFNLTKAELIEMEMNTEGGLAEQIQKVIETKDNRKIMEIFKNFIVKSYGIKSEDGLRFEKSEEISNAFTHSEAYSELFMELCTNETAAAAFVNGVIPKSISSQVENKSNK